MRPALAIAIAIAIAIALGGCLASAPTTTLDPAALALDIEAYALDRLLQDHDHAAGEEHAGRIGFAGALPVPARGSYPDGETYFDIAVKAGYAFMTFGPKSGNLRPNTEAGFVVYDLADPDAPTEVGRWLGQPLGDVEVTDDGAFAFASTQRNGYPYPWTIHPAAGALGQLPRGTHIVDLKDKANPRSVGFAPLPTNGPHTITYVKTPQGRELLLQSTYDFVFTTYPDNAGQNKLTQKVVISEFVRSPQPTLRPISVFQTLVPDSNGKESFPHDATAHVAADGRLIMDVAYWDLGLVMVDITDPAKPVELSRFADTAPSAYTRTHLARVFPGTIDGRLVAVMEPEIPSGTDDGQYTFVDVTDPKAPTKLGSWSLPGENVVDQPFIFSPHNFDLSCGGDGQVTGKVVDYAKPCERPTVLLSHFHGGLWTLDASDPASPRATGFYFPAILRTNVDAGFPFTGFANAMAYEGRAYAPEIWTGLHVLPIPGEGP